MATIIAGHFQLQQQIQEARAALRASGFADERISAFYVNQPGQHDLHALGGDEDRSPGARKTPQGVAAGGAAGGAAGVIVGALAAPVAGPLGPVLGGLVGAHVGTLYSFAQLKEAGAAEDGRRQRVPRKAGMLIAVALDAAAQEASALDVLHRLGADHIERAEGRIVDGDWCDFDPLGEPRLLE